jgi:PPOX class probable F420-dependent enzyme
MALDAFRNEKYLNLETYRRDGTPVRTPVWFALANAKLYIYAIADSGKVKRVRRNPTARIAPCDVRGNVTGPWTDVVVSVENAEGFKVGMRLLDQKYFPWKQLLKLGAMFSRRERVVLAISEPLPG